MIAYDNNMHMVVPQILIKSVTEKQLVEHCSKEGIKNKL